MRAKKTPWPLFLIFALLTANISIFNGDISHASSGNILISQPWGSQPGALGLIQSENEEDIGPSTFCVVGDHIFVLDSGNHRINIYDGKNGSFSSALPIPKWENALSEDLSVDRPGIIGISYPEYPAISVMDLKGQNIFSLDSSPPAGPYFKVPSRIYIADNSVWINDPALELTINYSEKGELLRLIRDQYFAISGKPLLFRPDIDQANLGRCKIMTKNPGDSTEKLYSVIYREERIHRCEIIGRDLAKNVYVFLLWGDMDITANAEVIKISPNGNATGKKVVPEWPGFGCKLHVRNDQKGDILYMNRDKKGFQIIREKFPIIPKSFN